LAVLILREFSGYAENGLGPHWVVVWVGFVVIASLGSLVACALVISGVLALRHDPSLIVGRVIGVLHGVKGRGPSRKRLILNWLSYGSAMTITVEKQACAQLRSDGSLDGDTLGRGVQEFGARRRVKRGAIMHERCVIICAGPQAIYLLGDFVSRLQPASAAHDPQAQINVRAALPSRNDPRDGHRKTTL
jgi:hypothetical protein